MVIGLTGGIGTGKSTVARLLHEIGLKIIDADRVYHGLLKPRTPMIEEIRRSFGAKYINTDGTLNRRLLGAKVFKDPTSRRLLEDLTHPVLRKELLVLVSAARRTGQDTVLDHPLLFEMKMETYVDQIWVVTSSKALQIARICARDGITAEEATERIKAQLPIEFKVEEADVVLENKGSLEKLKAEVEKKWRERLK